MRKVVIESTNLTDTAQDIEEMLQKAVTALNDKRENRPMKDEFLKEQIQTIDNIFKKVMDNMVSELQEAVK